jgi:hypothetical protein
MRDENLKSKGFGFVCFKEASCAFKALAENTGQPGGLYVKQALSKEQRQNEISRNTLSFKKSMQYLSLHVRGFSKSENSLEDLRVYFSSFG